MIETDRPRVLQASRRGRAFVGEPLFERGQQMPIAKNKVHLGEGRMVLCRIDRRGATPLVDLGRADRAGDVIAALVADRGLRATFPARLESDAVSAAETGVAHAPRTDLTGKPTFTVDPKSARDFDDAVSAEREGDGIRLWIHIADVSAHVRPGSGLDRAAYERANSTYAPGLVVPMLPKALSDQACSLNPGLERAAVTTEIELSADGRPVSARFYRSLIRSDARLDYGQLDRIFAGRERAPELVAEPIAIARDAAAAVEASRRGESLEVTSAEPEFEISPDGEVLAAHAVPQTESHRLIERLMVLTNEQVAELLAAKKVPTLYRVHEQPNPARIVLLADQLHSLDLPTPPIPEKMTPAEAGGVVVAASRLVAEETKRRGHGARGLSSLILRSMKQAVYSPNNLGHAGLGSRAYSHFTSPIRRYPDLIAHRALLATLGAGEDVPDRHEVERAAVHCSELERASMRIERDGDDICAGFLLERELLERGWDTAFEGEVSGVIGAGAFITFAGEKADVYEGFLPARRVRGERLDLNEHETALIASGSGKRIAVGDPVDVVVDRVERVRGRVDLVPADPQDRRGKR